MEGTCEESDIIRVALIPQNRIFERIIAYLLELDCIWSSFSGRRGTLL
jgi:hypothetical protein